MKCVQPLSAILSSVHKYASSQLMFPADVPLHCVSPGDWVHLKTGKITTLRINCNPSGMDPTKAFWL